jgi:hypothetical protein
MAFHPASSILTATRTLARTVSEDWSQVQEDDSSRDLGEEGQESCYQIEDVSFISTTRLGDIENYYKTPAYKQATPGWLGAGNFHR